MRAVVVAPVLALALVLAIADAHADDAPTSAPVVTSHDGPGMYIGWSYRLSRADDGAGGAETVEVIGVSTGGRYRYRCLEAGLGLALDWFHMHGGGGVVSGEAYVLRDVSTDWALGGRISAGGGAYDNDSARGDRFVGMAGVRARYRGVVSLSVDAYVFLGPEGGHTAGGLVGVGATGDVFKYGYLTGVFGVVAAAALIVFAPPPVSRI